MKLNRTFAILVCAVAFVIGATPSFADETWRVVQAVGAVNVGGGGLLSVAVTNKQDLPAGAWVETAATGRVLLVRGNETIVVAPMSRVQLPTAKVNGNTQVVQSLGSVLYQIGKEKKPHFQVNTPYLAAVVKGTTFTVTVENAAATVEVTEGLVEVATPDQSDSEFVRSGFTATVHENERTVSVDVTVTPPANSDEPKSTTRSIVIPQAIGDVSIDVKDATNGLINQPLLPPTGKPTTALTTAAADGDDNASTGDTGGGADNAGDGADNSGGISTAAVDLTPPDLGPGNSNAGGMGMGNAGENGNGGAGAGGNDNGNAGGNGGGGGGNGNGRGP